MENKTQYIIEIKTVPDSERRPIGWTTGTFSDIHFFESFSQAEEYVDRISKVVYAARISKMVSTFEIVKEFPNLNSV